MCQVKLMLVEKVSQLGAEPPFYCKMTITLLVLELQGGQEIRRSLLSSLISVPMFVEQ